MSTEKTIGVMRSRSSVQPVLMRMSIRQLTIFASLLPFLATIFCVTWSILFNFREANHTHCKVYNFFPSVSSTISAFAPQKYVWRICIALHCSPRFFLAISYYRFHTSLNVGRHNTLFKCVAIVNTILHIIELSALITLSYISSVENYKIHENMFILFIFSGVLYMILTCFLIGYGRTRGGRQLTRQEKKSLNIKVYLVVFDISVFLLSLYFFYRHNTYCEPGAYGYFAFCEYLGIMLNIGFHLTGAIDLKPVYVLIQAESPGWFMDTRPKQS